jgi:cell wall assembly regulator SMI1
MSDLKSLLLDKTQPLDLRVDAAQKLSHESRTLWNPLFIAIEDEDEDPVFRSTVLAIVAFRNPPASIQFLVRPFENPAVRRAAIEILSNLPPITGEQEVLLTAELSALRGTLTQQEIDLLSLDGQWKQILSAKFNQLRGPDADVNRSCDVINLSQTWGRDPRVLAFLSEELQRLEEGRRRDAVFSLCMLGELQPALDAANDPSTVVRSTLADRLGYYREATGIEVLQRLLEDSDPGVAKQAKTALRLLNQLEMPQTLGLPARLSAWSELLSEISRVQLADRNIVAEMPDDKVAAGWLGERAATETELISAEQRLGVRLPPSYRSFLAEANGFDHIGPFIYRLYSITEIDWFGVLNQDWIDAYQIGNDDVSPEEHLANPEDSVRFRAAYLSSCLQISEVGDSAVVLLNPEVINDEGEWETWFFANWSPGATRYPSFRLFLESELESLNSLRKSERTSG